MIFSRYGDLHLIYCMGCEDIYQNKITIYIYNIYIAILYIA